MPVGQFPRITRSLLVLLLAVLSGLLAAGTARAGGPTSALLVSPANGSAAALYYSDAEYDQLMTYLGGSDPIADPARTAPPNAGRDYVTVTWLIHDVSVWRIDRIVLDGTGSPWIVTQVLDGGQQVADGMYPGQSGNASAVWHRSPDPAGLQGLLSVLGILGPAAAGSFALSEPSDTAAGEPEAAGPGRPAVVDPVIRAGSPWWWVLGGLVAGAVLAALAIRFLPPVRRRLLDRPAEDHDSVRMLEIPV